MNPLYTAVVKTIGGRGGHSKSSDGILDLDVAFPVEMGGKGGATNPEQLFAAGWSACFGQSLAFVAAQHQIRLSSQDISVEAHVNVVQGEGGFYLTAKLIVNLKGIEKEQTAKLAEEAKHVCAYSKAVAGNVNYDIIIAE